MKIIHIQPAMPAYRLDFFRRLSIHYGDAMHVYYSLIDMDALTATRQLEAWEHPIGLMRKPMRGVEWQVGALSVKIQRGDLVIVCGAPRTLSTLLVLLIARLKGARSVWWGQYWTAGAHPMRQRLTMRLVHLADGILFYTQEEVSRFRADGWQHRGPVAGLNNGINLVGVRALRQAYDPAQRGRNLLFIGRLTEKARLELMIEAMARPSLSDVYLHIIGGGAQEAKLRAQAQATGVASRITWHAGTTDENRIAEVANRCAVFIYPGQVGLSLIHAMGYGLPCVVHGDRLKQMPEIAAFDEGNTGHSFDEGSAVSLAQSVSDILAAPSDRADMSLRCTEITRTDYSTERMAQRFIDFVQSMPVSGGSL